MVGVDLWLNPHPSPQLCSPDSATLAGNSPQGVTSPEGDHTQSPKLQFDICVILFFKSAHSKNSPKQAAGQNAAVTADPQQRDCGKEHLRNLAPSPAPAFSGHKRKKEPSRKDNSWGLWSSHCFFKGKKTEDGVGSRKQTKTTLKKVPLSFPQIHRQNTNKHANVTV